MAVDTHIFRVSNRTAIAPGKNPLEVEQRLLKFIPEEFRLHAHHWLILHGRYVCKARAPECPRCPICDLCEFKTKSRAGDDLKYSGAVAKKPIGPIASTSARVKSSDRRRAK